MIKPHQRVAYQRKFVTLEDGVQIALDWKEDEGMGPETPLVLIAHGLGEEVPA